MERFSTADAVAWMMKRLWRFLDSVSKSRPAGVVVSLLAESHIAGFITQDWELIRDLVLSLV